MKIFVASDHAGFHLKQRVIEHLRAQKHEVQDMGPAADNRVDYPDFAAPVGKAVRDTANTMGVLVCGSGLGMCIAANKINGVRAVDAFSVESSRLSRSHNDANVLCLGERLLPPDTALAVLDVFLNTPFEAGRHSARIEKISDLEAAESAQAKLTSGSGDKLARPVP